LISGAIAERRTAAATVVCGILFLLAAGFGMLSRRTSTLFAASAASILAAIEVTVAAVVESGAVSWLNILCVQAAALSFGAVIGRMVANLQKKKTIRSPVQTQGKGT